MRVKYPLHNCLTYEFVTLPGCLQHLVDMMNDPVENIRVDTLGQGVPGLDSINRWHWLSIDLPH